MTQKPKRVGLNPFMETAYEISIREAKVVEPDDPRLGGSRAGDASHPTKDRTESTVEKDKA